MKKTIISMAVIAASVFSFNATAQATAKAGDNATCTKKECPVAPGKDCRKARCNPFEGLNLTADQQAKLDQLRQQCATDRKACADQRRAEAKERRAERDSIARTKRLDNLKQIKGILTPDQYVTFLENIVISERAPMGPRFDRSGKPGKDFNKNGKKNDKDRKDKR